MEFNFHHIGGRWGTIPPVETWGMFKRYLNVTLYEVDPKSYDEIQRRLLKEPAPYGILNVVPYCVGSEDGYIDLNLCFDRNTCSTLPFNTVFSNWSFFLEKFDRGVYQLGVANAGRESLRVPSNTLDVLVARNEVNTPDGLSIDAEGASMEILKGAAISLNSVSAVFLEGNVVSVRHGEAPFHELLSYLQEKGFLLISMGTESRLSIIELPACVYDRGVITTFEDSIFLRNPFSVNSPEMLLKLAFVALLCGCTSILHVCFDKLDTLNFNFESAPDVLREFRSRYNEIKNLKLPKINETHTETMYNINSYIVSESEVSDNAITENRSHRKDQLRKYVPTLRALLDILNSYGGIYSPIFNKFGLTHLAELSLASEKKQVSFMARTLREVGLVKII